MPPASEQAIQPRGHQRAIGNGNVRKFGIHRGRDADFIGDREGFVLVVGDEQGRHVGIGQQASAVACTRQAKEKEQTAIIRAIGLHFPHLSSAIRDLRNTYRVVAHGGHGEVRGINLTRARKKSLCAFPRRGPPRGPIEIFADFSPPAGRFAPTGCFSATC